MNGLDPASYALARAILAGATEMTLATVRADGSPHASTVNFASDGIVLYAAIALDSNKSHDIRDDARVSLTVNAPFKNWNEIQGLSIDATATLVEGRTDHVAASALLLAKLPQYAAMVGAAPLLPWPGMLFIRILPTALILLDYTKQFGHAEHFDIVGLA